MRLRARGEVASLPPTVRRRGWNKLRARGRRAATRVPDGTPPPARAGARRGGPPEWLQTAVRRCRRRARRGCVATAPRYRVGTARSRRGAAVYWRFSLAATRRIEPRTAPPRWRPDARIAAAPVACGRGAPTRRPRNDGHA